MKAITRYTYGGPEVLRLEEVEKPIVQENHLLVRVLGNALNPADRYILRGKPFLVRFSFGLLKPKKKTIGADFAGVVEEIGRGVSQFAIGDSVFGESPNGGAFAEYLCVLEGACGLMSKKTGYCEMASVPLAGQTALQALITHGKLQKGESVLINGASGGVGHFAVQIAKAYGAQVTAVCSSRNATFIQSLGADSILAYDKEGIPIFNEKFDLVVDVNGNLGHSDFKRMGKRGVMVGFTTMNHMISTLLKSAFSKFPLAQFTAEANTKDLNSLAQLIEAGKVKPHIEKTYSYTRIPEAMQSLETMRARGKLAISWS